MTMFVSVAILFWLYHVMKLTRPRASSTLPEIPLIQYEAQATRLSGMVAVKINQFVYMSWQWICLPSMWKERWIFDSCGVMLIPIPKLITTNVAHWSSSNGFCAFWLLIFVVDKDGNKTRSHWHWSNELIPSRITRLTLNQISQPAKIHAVPMTPTCLWLLPVHSILWCFFLIQVISSSLHRPW